MYGIGMEESFATPVTIVLSRNRPTGHEAVARQQISSVYSKEAL
jgi:hypothetical protein